MKLLENREKFQREVEEERVSVKNTQDRLEADTRKRREKRHKRNEKKSGNAIPLDVKEHIVEEEKTERIKQTREDPHPEEPPRKVREANHPGLRIISQDYDL